MQNELTPQEQAVENQNTQYAQAESDMYDENGVDYNDPNAVEVDNMMNVAPQPDNEILDFEPNESYSNIYIYDLFNNLIDNAQRLRDCLDTEVQIDLIKRNQMKLLHDAVLKIDKFLKTAKIYADNTLNNSTYKKNVYVYLTYRNCYLNIVKDLKKALEI